MNFEYTKKSLDLQKKLKSFMEQYIYPNDKDRQQYTQNPKKWWQDYPKLEEWKAAAKAAGLWKINTVLDWEMCTLGDPLMDLGAAVAYWTMPTDHPTILKIFPYPTAMDGNPSRLEIVERYA